MTFADLHFEPPVERPEVQRQRHSVPTWQTPNMSGPEQQIRPSMAHRSVTCTSVPSSYREPKKRRLTEGSTHPYPTPILESRPDAFEQMQVEPQSATARLQQIRHSQSPAGGQPLESHVILPGSHTPGAIPTELRDTIAVSTPPANHNPTLTRSAFSPSFSFSPMATHTGTPNYTADHLRPITTAEDTQTPGGLSASAQSSHTVDGDNDPFLSFLEQLAENDSSGNPDGLDFFMNGSANDSAYAEPA
jgi:hypothetical protein